MPGTYLDKYYSDNPDLWRGVYINTLEVVLPKAFEKKKEDKLTKYYNLLDTIHGKGYMSEDAVEAVNVFYSQYEGLSDINQCVRQTIMNYVTTFMTNIETGDYTEYFELSKI